MTKYLIINLISVSVIVAIILGQHAQAKGIDTPVGKRNAAQFNRKSCLKIAVSSSATGLTTVADDMAKLNWTLQVTNKYGGKYAKWSIAKNRQINCGQAVTEENEQGGILSGHSCTASGIPCKFN